MKHPKLKYVVGDLFEIVDKSDVKEIAIPHVVNDVPAWGAGFVVPLAKKYPRTKTDYFEWHKYGQRPQGQGIILDEPSPIHFALGNVRSCSVVNEDNKQVYVVHMLAQHGIGGKRPLNYAALTHAMLRTVKGWYRPFHIYCPLFGAGLAGGDWNIIENLIIETWCETAMLGFYADVNVTVCIHPSEKDKWKHLLVE